jgi:hypothetical protein
VEAIPVKLWNWGILNCSGSLRTFPKEKIQLALMPKESGSVTEKGIYFKKLYYSCPKAREALWFENARKNGRYAIDISYDPRDMNVIFVWEKDGNGVIPCTLLDWEQRFSGKSAEEVEFEQKKQEIQKKKNERAEKESVINLNRRIDAIVQTAEEMMPSNVGKTKEERLADIRENRKEEQESIRAEEAFTSDDRDQANRIVQDASEHNSQEDPFTITSEEWENMSPIDRMIYQDVQKRQKNDSSTSES